MGIGSQFFHAPSWVAVPGQAARQCQVLLRLKAAGCTAVAPKGSGSASRHVSTSGSCGCTPDTRWGWSSSALWRPARGGFQVAQVPFVAHAVIELYQFEHVERGRLPHSGCAAFAGLLDLAAGPALHVQPAAPPVQKPARSAHAAFAVSTHRSVGPPMVQSVQLRQFDQMGVAQWVKALFRCRHCAVPAWS